MNSFIVVDHFDKSFIVTDESGNVKTFKTYAEALDEAADCQVGQVVNIYCGDTILGKEDIIKMLMEAVGKNAQHDLTKKEVAYEIYDSYIANEFMENYE